MNYDTVLHVKGLHFQNSSSGQVFKTTWHLIGSKYDANKQNIRRVFVDVVSDCQIVLFRCLFTLLHFDVWFNVSREFCNQTENLWTKTKILYRLTLIPRLNFVITLWNHPCLYWPGLQLIWSNYNKSYYDVVYPQRYQTTKLEIVTWLKTRYWKVLLCTYHCANLNYTVSRRKFKSENPAILGSLWIW